MSKSIDENIEEDVSNDLKEFGVDSDAPDLFSSETESSSSSHEDYYLQGSMKKKMILKYQHS